MQNTQPQHSQGGRRKECNMCGAVTGQTLLKCSACKLAWYCSKDCQKRAWRGHKAECAEFQSWSAGAAKPLLSATPGINRATCQDVITKVPYALFGMDIQQQDSRAWVGLSFADLDREPGTYDAEVFQAIKASAPSNPHFKSDLMGACPLLRIPLDADTLRDVGAARILYRLDPIPASAPPGLIRSSRAGSAVHRRSAAPPTAGAGAGTGCSPPIGAGRFFCRALLQLGQEAPDERKLNIGIWVEVDGATYVRCIKGQWTQLEFRGVLAVELVPMLQAGISCSALFGTAISAQRFTPGDKPVVVSCGSQALSKLMKEGLDRRVIDDMIEGRWSSRAEQVEPQMS